MYLQVKKIPTVKSKKKINQLPVLMPRLNGVRGDKVFFPPTKDIGTREGVQSGTGKHFPKRETLGKFCINIF